MTQTSIFLVDPWGGFRWKVCDKVTKWRGLENVERGYSEDTYSSSQDHTHSHIFTYVITMIIVTYILKEYGEVNHVIHLLILIDFSEKW